MLTKPLSSELVKAGLDILNVSYNGPGREEYERVMRGMRFDQLKENIRGFIEARGENPRPVLSLQSSTPDVENQKKEILKIGSALGIEVVQFYAFNNRAGYLPQGLEANTIPLTRRFCYKILFIAWDGTIYPCSHDIKGTQPLGNICRVSLDEVRKEDYPLCAPCTICGTQGLREHTIVKNVFRYKVRRLISRVYS
jgi:MoaA/NifB/PqqE/SkfB family radical SAM enzyme